MLIMGTAINLEVLFEFLFYFVTGFPSPDGVGISENVERMKWKVETGSIPDSVVRVGENNIRE